MTRGFDGTSATSHSSGAPIEVILTAVEMDETNGHAFDTSRDDHTQYLTTGRHANIQHDTSMIADGAITQPKLAKPAVGTPELFDDAVTGPKILTGAVGTDALADGGVTTPKLGDLAVTEPKLGDLAVATAKLDDTAVTEAKLATDAVTTDKIEDATVTNVKLAGDVPVVSSVATYASLPASGIPGQRVWVTDDSREFTWNGTMWIVSGGANPYFNGTRISWSVANHQWLPVSFDFGGGGSDDPDGFLDTGNARLKVPPGLGGRYMATAGGWWDPIDSGGRYMRFRVASGALPAQAQWKSISVQVGAGATINQSFPLNEGDWIAWDLLQTSSQTLTFDGIFMQLDYLGANP